ncbi:MAG: redoxin domain-containing protein [Dysgonomonas sp.]
MKKNILFAFVLFFFLSGKAQQTLTLSGTVASKVSGKVYLQKFDEKLFFTIDSAQIVAGKFSFSTKLKLPEIYGLSLNPKEGTYFVFLDNNPTEVVLDSLNGYKNTTVKGSEQQDLFISYRKQKDVKIDDFIRQHPESLVSAYVLYRDFAYRLNADEIKANVKLLSPELQTTPYVNTLNELAKVYETVAVGKKAPLFEAKSTDGQLIKLSDLLGKGYLLVDFWASWCGPCRKENPNVVKAYQKYKSKGFDILAVSLDENRDAWLKAIEKDGLLWTQVSDLKSWHSEPAKLYGVRAIPANFLISPEGVIVAKNLDGDDLDNALGSFLGN